MRGLKPACGRGQIRRGKVASFTDAWIETRQRYGGHHSRYVASFTDAWIETTLTTALTRPKPSHLLQMRGLKLKLKNSGNKKKSSHLLQMRGLKQRIGKPMLLKESRIFYRCVDWNQYKKEVVVGERGRIFYRCVDWNQKVKKIYINIYVASFTDAWIETSNAKHGWNKQSSHLLQMRGLKHLTVCDSI